MKQNHNKKKMSWVDYTDTLPRIIYFLKKVIIFKIQQNLKAYCLVCKKNTDKINSKMVKN